MQTYTHTCIEYQLFVLRAHLYAVCACAPQNNRSHARERRNNSRVQVCACVQMLCRVRCLAPCENATSTSLDVILRVGILRVVTMYLSESCSPLCSSRMTQAKISMYISVTSYVISAIRIDYYLLCQVVSAPTEARPLHDRPIIQRHIIMAHPFAVS